MARRESTIGVVHWDALSVLGDGEQLIIEIPAYFEAYHVAYLTSALAPRLADVFDGDEVVFSLEPGQLREDSTGAEYVAGRILIEGVSQPWPHAKTLQEALDTAFVAAAEVEKRQRELAKELTQHLRKA